jgi:hypothetical protein
MRRRRIVAIAAIVGLATTVGVGVAVADDVYQGPEYTYTSNEICTRNAARTAHGNGNGLAETYIEVETEFGWGPNCVWAYDRPPGYIALAWEWYEWRTDQWALCNYSGWQYNQETRSWMQRQKVFFSNQTCGSGYYGTMAGGFAWNGGWYGGWMWSGYHWFPA